MVNNNNRRICFIIYHVISVIIYLVCISLSIYGYYVFFALELFSSGYTNFSPDFTWLIVAIILDVVVCILSIVQCGITCCYCCGGNKTPAAQAPVVMMYPTTNYTTATPANAYPPVNSYPAENVKDTSKINWFPNKGETGKKNLSKKQAYHDPKFPSLLSYFYLACCKKINLCIF
jgi:hypothetical protein